MRAIVPGRALACGLAACLFFSGHALFASHAHAQTEEELERARTAFAEGVQLTAEERWPEAVARFRAVIAGRATPQVRWNLAVALFHSGEIAEAALHLGQVVDAEELDRRTRREARAMLDEITPRLAHVTVRLLGDEGGATVMLDDRELGLDLVGQSIPVDPGDHRVVVRRGGEVVASREVHLAEGETADVALTPGPGGTVDPELVDREVLTRGEEPRPSENVLEQWWFWTAIGGGVLVVAGIAIGVGVATSSGGDLPPVQGNLQPGVIDVTLP